MWWSFVDIFATHILHSHNWFQYCLISKMACYASRYLTDFYWILSVYHLHVTPCFARNYSWYFQTDTTLWYWRTGSTPHSCYWGDDFSGSIQTYCTRAKRFPSWEVIPSVRATESCCCHPRSTWESRCCTKHSNAAGGRNQRLDCKTSGMKYVFLFAVSRYWTLITIIN